MIDLMKRHVIFFYIFQILSCNSGHNTVKETIQQKKTENIFGLYSYYVTGNKWHCETIKHSLILNTDSTFVYKIYCYADSTSLLKPLVKAGRFTRQGDFVFHFICSDDSTFNTELFTNAEIEIIPNAEHNHINYVFI
jgi:hypothetical protein